MATTCGKSNIMHKDFCPPFVLCPTQGTPPGFLNGVNMRTPPAARQPQAAQEGTRAQAGPGPVHHNEKPQAP